MLSVCVWWGGGGGRGGVGDCESRGLVIYLHVCMYVCMVCMLGRILQESLFAITARLWLC